MPERGTRNPATACSSVDLPEPDGPSSASTSPGATARLTPRSAVVAVVGHDQVGHLEGRLSRHGPPRGAGRGPQPADRSPQQQRRNGHQQREDDGQRGGRPDPPELLAVEHDHRQRLAARPVQQAGHGDLVQRGQEADQPGAEQRRGQRPQRDRADGGEHAGAARPRRAQLVGGQPVEGPGDRPVRERPQLGQVGQQDQRQRAGQPAPVGDQQGHGERRAGQHQRQRDQRGRGRDRTGGARSPRPARRAAPAATRRRRPGRRCGRAPRRSAG